jgi:hypothetical protein
VTTAVAEPIRLAIELRSPVQYRMRGFLDQNFTDDPTRMVRSDARIGYTLAICGAGPSLARADIHGVDAIWACNSALPYLIAKGVTVTVGIGIDQTKGLLTEWASVPNVPYYLATTCDPDVVELLADRPVSFFHNWVGLEGERSIYDSFPPSIVVGEGFTVVSRAVGLALWLGYERVDVYGADCSFGPDDTAHANGERATVAYQTPLILTGEINGRTWRTRPDMLMDAVHLVRRVRSSQGKVRLMGDTLPVCLLGKDEETLNLVCRSLTPNELPTPEVPDGQQV